MSTKRPSGKRDYEDYSVTSANYDANRRPLGVDIILHIIAAAGLRVGDARLLDAGCGTGNYLAALASSARELVGLELARGMLERAAQKLAGAPHVDLRLGSVLEMPFESGSFDAVMFNQVIHHLDDPVAADQSWPNLAQALQESHRVLRPGGVLIINTCSRAQVCEGFWYAALIPEAVERLAQRYVPIEALCGLLESCGFSACETVATRGEAFYGDRGLDPAGPFDKSWRDGDSVWSLVKERELERALARLRALHDAGEAAAFVEERERACQTVGQSVFVHARRP